MKKLAKSLFMLALSAALVLSVAACTNPNPPPAPTVEKIQIATAGKTEFTVGDDFSVGSLVVEEVKSDASKRALTADEITVDSSAYNKTKAGTYSIVIKLKSDTTKTVSYDVNVNIVPFANPYESLTAALDAFAEADIQTALCRESRANEAYESSLTLLDDKVLLETRLENLGEVETYTVTYINGTIYVKTTAYGKEELEKKAGTASDVLDSINYDESMYNPAGLVESFNELVFADIVSEDITYSIVNMVHIMEISLDWTDITIKIDSDGKITEISLSMDSGNVLYAFSYDTDKTIAMPSGTYTDAVDKSISEMMQHSLTPDAFADSAAAYNAILAAIDNTAAINNICITYNLEGYSEDLGGDIEQSLVLNKSNGNTKLISEIVVKVQDSRVMEIYQEVTFIDGTLYVYNYTWMTGYGEMIDEGEYITGVTEVEFNPLFESYYATFGGMLESSFLKEMFQDTADLQYEDETISGEHMITTQDDDGLLTVIITDSKYLREIIIEAEDGAGMSYHYNYWNEVNVPDEELIEYSTDVTGQKTAAQVFELLTSPQM